MSSTILLRNKYNDLLLQTPLAASFIYFNICTSHHFNMVKYPIVELSYEFKKKIISVSLGYNFTVTSKPFNDSSTLIVHFYDYL